MPDIPLPEFVVMSMNTAARRVVLVLTILLGLYVGIWAQFFHESFYSDFPGFGLGWIRISGPDNEHLVSDTGSAYLAFAAISVIGLVSPRAGAGRLAGVAWSVFGLFHFAFHISHPMGDSTDRIGTVITLALSAALGLLLLALPPARPIDGAAGR